MDIGMLGYVGALVFAAIGSAYGIGVAGMAVIGVWKKDLLAGKKANAVMFAFAGAPLTQTILGLVLMNALKNALDAGVTDSPVIFTIGVFGGIALGISSAFQGKCGAASADALGATGKGFAQYMIILGIVETVSLFVMAFCLGQIPTV